MNGPALPLLLRLEADGFSIDFRNGRLVVRPAHLLSAPMREAITAHRCELLTLVRICDEGVQDRRRAFVGQLAAGVSVGRLVVRAGIHAAGVCFSCADRLSRPTFGLCWRCALAWRLAAAVPIAADLLDAYDVQREVA
jgi:hypothetical protein